MKITKQRLKEIIKEELSEMDLPTYKGDPFGEYDLEAENKKGRQEELANYLLKMYQDLSETGDVMTIREIIQDNFNSALKDAEDAFLGDDDEVSDEDALVLKGPKYDPLGDSLAARRLRAIARRKDGDK
tara:strand:- start:326 stop:712 length:387 start_codon:yes stop_codon:yes gene_type:complete